MYWDSLEKKEKLKKQVGTDLETNRSFKQRAIL